MKISILVLLLLLQLTAGAQWLLANGGFEDENICTEYHINCAPAAWICTSPSFIFYFKEAALAHRGTHFMGLLAGHSNSAYKRTFVRSRLVCSLHRGKRYRLVFFVKSPHAILDSAGVYFSNYDFLFEKNVYHKIVPSVYLADAATRLVRTDTSWQQVVINYTATGEENFIAIGYFGKQDLKGSTGIRMENNFLILIDDISMEPVNTNELVCAGWKNNVDSIYSQHERHEYLDREIRLYRNNPPPVYRWTATTIPAIDTLIIPDILFATGSAAMNPQIYPLLDSFCLAIGKKKIDSLVVSGHTDSIGTAGYNTKLSASRAAAVVAYIKQKSSIDTGRIKIKFFGYLKPVASNATVEGRQKNRRVELLLYRHE